MLKSLSYRDKKKSIYICDRCRKEVPQERRYGIYIAKPYENIKKAWDFCPHCTAMLEKGVNK